MCLKWGGLSVCFSSGRVYSLATCFQSSLVRFSRFSHAFLALWVEEEAGRAVQTDARNFLVRVKSASDGALVVDPCARNVVGEVAADSPFVPEAQPLGKARALLGRAFSKRFVRRLRAGIEFEGLGALAAPSRFLLTHAETMREGSAHLPVHLDACRCHRYIPLQPNLLWSASPSLGAALVFQRLSFGTEVVVLFSVQKTTNECQPARPAQVKTNVDTPLSSPASAWGRYSNARTLPDERGKGRGRARRGDSGRDIDAKESGEYGRNRHGPYPTPIHKTLDLEWRCLPTPHAF